MQRILGRLVAIARRKQRRPLRVRAVVRAAGGDAHPAHVARFQHPQHGAGFVERARHVAVLQQAEAGGVLSRIDLGHAGAIGALAVRHDVERREADHHLQPRHGGANAVDDLAHEARAVFEAAAEPSRALARAEQLVAEIAVAVLDVDESEPGFSGQRCGRDEVVDHAADLIVGQHADRTRKPAIEDGVRHGGQRLGTLVPVGLRKTARVGQLKPDVEIGVRTGAEPLDVGRDQLLAQPRDGRKGSGGQHQLVRVGASIVANGDRLAAPDQLRAALAEVLPAADREIGRLAAGRAVPPFHRQHAEAVADAHVTDLEWVGKRRRTGRGQLAIEVEPDAGCRQMLREAVGRAEGRDAGIPVLTHAPARPRS